ncbi:MAG: MoxR family ATPase [Oscillospiraceae bacterium]|nr:MoxR family ATPase [Oscillospiraceae bacterium]
MNEKLKALLEQLSSVIFGKEKECRLTVCALLAGGDLLVEDVPGVGKTTLAVALAKSLALSFGRIQFTPDTLPGDVTGYSTIDMRTGELCFHEGPVMHNIVLADEINRTSPKTQASLLEVMAERQVTVEGRTIPLPRPFMVIATENPIEFAGTYHLPEAQLDRFLMRISMGYPSEADELEMLRARLAGADQASLEPVLTGEEVLELQKAAADVRVTDEVMRYIIRIISETRKNKSLTLGASPRATIALASCARAWALLEGRDYVTPQDVQAVAPYVLTHRLVLSLEASMSSVTVSGILKECVNRVAAPPVLKV